MAPGIQNGAGVGTVLEGKGQMGQLLPVVQVSFCQADCLIEHGFHGLIARGDENRIHPQLWGNLRGNHITHHHRISLLF